MQTPVSLVVLGVSLLVAIPLTAQQPNREAQARALEALRQKMAEMENAPAPAQTTPPPASRPAPVTTPPPAANTPPPVATQPPFRTTSTSTPVSNDVDAALREALNREMGQPAGTASTAPSTPAPRARRMAVMPDYPEPPPPSSPNVTLEYPSLAAPMATPPVETPFVQPPAVASSPAVATPTVTPRPSTPAQMGPIVIADGVSEALNPPPSRIDAAKEQKLANLLQQYRANTISPEDYHKQRAEILAGN